MMGPIGQSIQVEVLSGASSTGLRAEFAVRGPRGSSRYQVLRLDADLPRVVGAPVVAELEAGDVVAEVLRCVPAMPERPGVGEPDLEAVSLPWESALLLTADPHGSIATEVGHLSGWSEVPEALGSVLGPPRAWCCVLTLSAGGSRLRHWICGDRGWLELGLDNGNLCIVPISRDAMRCRLVHDLTAAVGCSLSAVG